MKANPRCARGGMADTPDLGSGSARIGGSSPLARTTFAGGIGVSGIRDPTPTENNGKDSEAEMSKWPVKVKQRNEIPARIYGPCAGRDSCRVVWKAGGKRLDQLP